MKNLASIQLLLGAAAASTMNFYGVEPDTATLQHFSYLQQAYPDEMTQVKALYISNSTADGVDLARHQYDLSDYQPIPKMSPSSSMDIAEANPDVKCRSGDGEQCNWIANSDNRGFVCHTLAGLSGISGAVAGGVIINSITCPKPQRPGKLQITVQVAWGVVSAAAGAAAIDYCPTALSKLSSCQYDGQVSKQESDVDFVYSIDNEPNNDVDCAELRQDYGGDKVACKEVSK